MVLSVVGTMKAGKSTTINAIVGREILPNRNRPMTALPTRIIHTPGRKNPVLRFDNPAVSEFAAHLGKLLAANPHWQDTPEIKDNPDMQKLIAVLSQQHTGFKFKKSYETEEAIYDFLSGLNDLVRLSAMLQQPLRADHEQQKNQNIQATDLLFPYGACQNIDQLPTIEIEFSHLKEHDGVEGRLVLLDTPGPNEAGQEHLKPMLEEQLRRSSAVLLVLDYTQLKSEAGEDVRLQLEKIPQLEKDRLFALVNKFDQTNANSDDAETTRAMIAGDFLKDRIEKEHIFPVSSQLCYLANRMEDEIAANGKPELGGWVNDFAKEALGAIYEQMWNTIDEKYIAKTITAIRKMSRMAEPIDLVIVKTQTEAPQIAMRSALAQIGRLLNDVQNFCQAHIGTAKKDTEEEKKKLEEEIERLNGKIDELCKLQITEKEKLKKIQSEINQGVKLNILKLQNNTNDKIEEELHGIFNSIEELERKNTKVKRIFLGLETEQTAAERKRIQQEAKEIIDEIGENKDILIFSNQEEKDKFHNFIMSSYNEIAEGINKKTRNVIKKGQKEITDALAKAKTQCQHEFDIIKENFSKHNIEIILIAPEFSEFEKNNIKQLEYRYKAEQINKKMLREERGFVAMVKRLLNLGGYREDEVTWFKVSKSEMIEQIKKDLDEQIFEPTKQLIKETFDDYSSQFINDYIGAVKRQAEQLKQEFDNALNAGKLEGKKKEAYLKLIRMLEKRSADIKDTLDDCRRIFGRPSEN